MRVKYSRDVDILQVRLSDAPVDYAEEAEGIITHFSAEGMPVFLEIQEAREFILGFTTSLVKDKKVRLS
jgi:hypothetical protein